MELSRTDLRHPDVHLSVPVRQERYELTVARHRSRLLHSLEVRDFLESRLSDRISPEVLSLINPEADSKCQQRNQGYQRQNQSPLGTKRGERRVERQCGGDGRWDTVDVFLQQSQIAAAADWYRKVRHSTARLQFRALPFDRDHQIVGLCPSVARGDANKRSSI